MCSHCLEELLIVPVEPLDHNKIAAAGWAYRTNTRGWIIYRNPETGLWHPRVEALQILGQKASGPSDSSTAGQPRGTSAGSNA